MFKRYLLITAVILGNILCGCGKKSEETVLSSAEEYVVETESESSEETEQTPVLDAVALWKKEETASAILEDEDALYFMGEDHITRFEKDSISSHCIWGSTQERSEDAKSVYKNTGGILIGNVLYFTEKAKDEEGNDKYILSTVFTDGNGYERIREIENGLEHILSVNDSVLYYGYDRDSYSLMGYKIDQNGKLLADEPVTFTLSDIPDGYSLPYYYQEGYRAMTFAESKSRYGFYLLRNAEYAYCRIDPETGAEMKLPDRLDSSTLWAANDTCLLFADYGEEKLYLYDPRTEEVRRIGDFNTDSHPICMDDVYLYQYVTVSGDDFTQHHYERISLENGETEELFVKNKIVGLGINEPKDAMEPAFLNGYLYYPGEDGYQLYVMRRSVDMPNAEEKLGDPFFDSRIGELGCIESQKDTLYGKMFPECITASWDLEWLVLDDRFDGAETINLILEEEQKGNIQYEKDNSADMEETVDEETGPCYYYYYFESSPSPIYYWDGTYLSFTQQNYDYMGGAHGMPYWQDYVFNVHTGEQLALGDIVKEEETQIKELVSQAFALMYEKEPDLYWPDAVDTVYESAGLDSPFYLTEEGIVFFFGPYELASFAAGFQEVLVPYPAWDLKINLKQKIG